MGRTEQAEEKDEQLQNLALEVAALHMKLKEERTKRSKEKSAKERKRPAKERDEPAPKRAKAVKDDVKVANGTEGHPVARAARPKTAPKSATQAEGLEKHCDSSRADRASSRSRDRRGRRRNSDLEVAERVEHSQNGSINGDGEHHAQPDRSDRDAKTMDRKDKSAKLEKPDKTSGDSKAAREKTAKIGKSDRTEKGDKAAKTSRMERAERAEHLENMANRVDNRAEKKAKKFEKTEKTEKAERIEKGSSRIEQLSGREETNEAYSGSGRTDSLTTREKVSGVVEKNHNLEKDRKTNKADKAEKADRAQRADRIEKAEKKPSVKSPRRERTGPCAASALDDEELDLSEFAGSSYTTDSEASSVGSGLSGSAVKDNEEELAPKQIKAKHDDKGQKRAQASISRSASGRTRRHESAGLVGACGFSAQVKSSTATAYSPVALPSADTGSQQVAVLPEKVLGLLNKSESLAQEVQRMKQAMEARNSQKAAPKEDADEHRETVLRMPPRLHESLLHPDNESKLLKRTGLAGAALNEDGLVILRADTERSLRKALGQLRRVAYHCQWGCSKEKVGLLLAEKPARPVNTMVVRLAATSSRLRSHEAKLTPKVRKLRIGTQAGICQMVVDSIPGLSRRHCTITFEPEKASCYVQDLSTNGTYLNGKRLPRPPYKNPQDARVRLFHGDELFFRLRDDVAEELGYVVNLLELS